MNICNKCKGRLVMHGFSKSLCTVCNTEMNCSHTPPDKVCIKCSRDNNLCSSCGKKME